MGENKVITYRDYKQINREKFKELINVGLDLIKEGSVNMLGNLMVKEIIRCLDIMAPLKTIVLRRKWQEKCWFCEDVKEMMMQKKMRHIKQLVQVNIKKIGKVLDN